MNAYEFIIKMRDYASSELRNVARSAGVADREVDELNRSSRNLGNTMQGLKRIVGTVFTVAAITMFTSKVIDARAEYERFEAVLTNTFQSADRGKASLAMLTDFAAKTPFQVNELTGSFVKLANRGFVPTMNEMTKLGDLASSQGKGFDQLAEAILDAETAEFERLKEFGIRASKSGDQISFAFKGVTKTVDNNSEAIRGALMEYGKMEGVAGSMAAISKTLGGRISNLKDQWNMFLVAVGGEGSGVLTGFIDMVSAGLSVITTYLPHIAEWFKTLWGFIQPVAIALWNFLDAAFGFGTAGDLLSTFGSIMSGILLVVDYLTTGLTFLIDTLTPIADWVMSIAIAWGIWNYAIGAFNALMMVNPITWWTLGIIALIAVIGAVIKYTEGWGTSWQATVDGAKFLWQGFTSQAKSHFLVFVNGIMIGINKIKEGWFEFKNAVGLGDSSENNSMLRQIELDTQLRKQEILDAQNDAFKNFAQAGKAFSNFSITVDSEGIQKDFNSIKKKFSGVGQGGNVKSFLTDDEEKETETGTGTGKAGTAGADTIVSGGTRRTEINITIQKLQDDTKIFVSNTEEGLSGLGDKVQEIILRAVNSINQMQTT